MPEPTHTDIVAALNNLILEHQEIVSRATTLMNAIDTFRLNPTLSGDLNAGSFRIFSDDGEGGGLLRLGGDQIEIAPDSSLTLRRAVFPDSQEIVTTAEAITLGAIHNGAALVCRSPTGVTITVGAAFNGKVMILNPLRELITITAPAGTTVNGSEDPATFEKGSGLIRRHSSTAVEVY
jgi:hypothetical protein